MLPELVPPKTSEAEAKQQQSPRLRDGNLEVIDIYSNKPCIRRRRLVLMDDDLVETRNPGIVHRDL